MRYKKNDSNVSKYEGILDIVTKIWNLLEVFIERLPNEVNYTHFETQLKEYLNEIRNFFN